MLSEDGTAYAGVSSLPRRKLGVYQLLEVSSLSCQSSAAAARVRRVGGCVAHFFGGMGIGRHLRCGPALTAHASRTYSHG